MFKNKRAIGLAISALMLIALTAFTIPANSNNAPSHGGFLTARNGILTDDGTGIQFNFDLIAREGSDTPGVGQLTLSLQGSGISLCSTHGPQAAIDFSPGGEDFGGNTPLQDVRCGTAYDMSVNMAGSGGITRAKCSADMEFHGYSHSDYPFIAYMGPITADLSLRKGNRPSNTRVQLTLYTPKGPINLRGNLAATVDMDTCP